MSPEFSVKPFHLGWQKRAGELAADLFLAKSPNRYGYGFAHTGSEFYREPLEFGVGRSTDTHTRGLHADDATTMHASLQP